MMTIWHRIKTLAAVREHVSGEPRSPNGASSFHLVWELPQVPLIEVSATLEVLQPPQVSRLYFWALQVTFVSNHLPRGGAHIGLQWNPHHAGSTAVNWGGYAAADVGGLLDGSPSPILSGRADPNTRDFPWQAGRQYRLHVGPGQDAPPGHHAWRGTVTDLETGNATAVRDLYTRGDRLGFPMVWTEVFARCEQPTVAARWSDLWAMGEDGSRLAPTRARVNYQARVDGGCDNTSVVPDELGLVQATSMTRQVPQGALLPVTHHR